MRNTTANTHKPGLNPAACLGAYLGAFVAMAVLDAVWLGLIAKPLYEQGIGHLMADKPNLGVAALFYLVYPVGLVIFAISPQTGGTSRGRTLTMAALFGLFAYGTYDVTNLATLRGWPVGLSLVDVVWGMVVSSGAAFSGRLAMGWAQHARQRP